MAYRDEFIYHIMTVYDRLAQPLQDALKPYGITAKNFFVMQFIDMQPGVSQMDVAAAIHKDKTQAGQYIDKLERKGYAMRRPGSDRRTNALYLTDEGTALVRRYEGLLSETRDALLDGIDARDRENLYRVMKFLAE